VLALSSQGHVLLQIGVALLLAICFEGFFVQKLRSPRMGLSVHTLATFEALLFLAFGLMWPTLKLTGLGASLAFWLFVYSAFATLVPYVLAAVWGAGAQQCLWRPVRRADPIFRSLRSRWFSIQRRRPVSSRSRWCFGGFEGRSRAPLR
jgi:hypothetical protein